MRANDLTNARTADIDTMSINQGAVAKLRDAIVIHSRLKHTMALTILMDNKISAKEATKADIFS
jgi:hypothetical protein